MKNDVKLAMAEVHYRIQDGEYELAKRLLKEIDTRKAREWEIKLDRKISASNSEKRKKAAWNAAQIVFVVLVILLVAFMGVMILNLSNNPSPAGETQPQYTIVVTPTQHPDYNSAYDTCTSIYGEHLDSNMLSKERKDRIRERIDDCTESKLS